MKTTSAAQSIRATITEGLTSDAKVDRTAGVIRGVKLIGFESKNGRIYPAHVLKSAVPLYEGSKVNIDHPQGNDPTQPRKYNERFGVIRNARFMEGKGTYGDFHFNPHHPSAAQVMWDAENNPEALGFSHNALLKLGQSSASGKQVIEQIVSIRSMDLVADPATTTSLFESEEPMEPTATPAMSSPSDPKAAMKGAFRQMIMAAVDDESLDVKATMKKIAEIMKAQAKLMGETTPSEDSDPAEESLQLKQQVGLLTQQLEQYHAKEKRATLIAAIDKALVTEGLDPKNPQHVSELFSKQLLATENEADRAALIKDRAALLGATARKPPSGPTYTPPTASMTEQLDAKAFASRLLS